MNPQLFFERLKTERQNRGLNQDDMAKKVGVSKRSYCAYEAGETAPSAKLLAALALMGIDIGYILTGQRNPPTPDSSPTITDRTRLVTAIEAVEAGLAETKRRLPPKQKAELVLSAYDLMAQPEQSRDNVIRLVRAAA